VCAGAVRAHPELGGQHHPVAAAVEALADEALALAVPVDVGGVEEGDSRVERRVDDALGRGAVQAAPEVVGAEADAGNLDVRVGDAA
jgi:hypothetical protein